MTALAALLKPILGPVMIFAGLLIARWGSIIVWRILPESRIRRLLFDKKLLDESRWLLPTIWLVCVVALFLYGNSFH